MEWKEGEEPAKGVKKDVEAEREGMARSWSPSNTTYLSAGEQNTQHCLQNPRNVVDYIRQHGDKESVLINRALETNIDSGDKRTRASSPD